MAAAIAHLVTSCASKADGEVAANACEPCAKASYICGSPGVESVNLMITAQTPTGCSGTLHGGDPISLDCTQQGACTVAGCGPYQYAAHVITFQMGTATVTCE